MLYQQHVDRQTARDYRQYIRGLVCHYSRARHLPGLIRYNPRWLVTGDAGVREVIIHRLKRALRMAYATDDFMLYTRILIALGGEMKERNYARANTKNPYLRLLAGGIAGQAPGHA